MFLSTTGGHLAELDSLARRIPPDGDAVWVTHANEQSISMLAGRDVEFVPYVGVRNVVDVLHCLPSAHRLWRRGITRAVSTGSGIALGYLPYLAARGVACHYVESAARVDGPSLTGRVLERVPRVHTYTQYTHWAGRRWRYGGSDFDCYEPVSSGRPLGDVIRVVVTVGTAAEFAFRRLIVGLSGLLARGGPLQQATGLPVEVLWQTGGTPAADLPISPTPFLPAADLQAALARADIVVSHAGMGSAIAALQAGRLPLLAARRRREGEAGDDHQRELAAELARRGLALHRDPGAITVDDLLATVGTSIHTSTAPPPFQLCS
ncbi:MAG: glycosyltransferase family 28 [Pseudonocardiaceae bacterium]|nr:glycosyltransferase family 28 [Pseudonocardiaceae bacterium]